MADDLCKSPVDLIANPPSGPKFSTGGGKFGGVGGEFPDGTGNSVVDVKIFDKAIPDPPKDETRG